MGPMIYRIAFEPIAHASVLVLLIASFGVHFSLIGLGLLFFGPEGIGTTPLSSQILRARRTADHRAERRGAGGDGACCWCCSRCSSAAPCSARRCAPARRTVSARGWSAFRPRAAGQIAFALAALIGAVSGVLVGPLMTVAYDSGFLIGLKAFVAAIIGGLVSYPLTVLAALGVGFAEALFSFWASNFKEVLVFTADHSGARLALARRAACRGRGMKLRCAPADPARRRAPRF